MNTTPHTNGIDWSEYARCYDVLLHLTPYTALQQEICAELEPRSGETIFEAGCGTGNLTTLMAKTCPGATFNAIDASAEMLDRARSKCAELKNIALSNCDLNAPLHDLGEATHDAVVSVNVLYALTEPLSALREWARILRPGGRLVVSTPKFGNENGLILKAHAKSPKPDSYWHDLHASVDREEVLLKEALKNSGLVEQMLLVARCNRLINQVASFVFFSLEELEALVVEGGFHVSKRFYAYADQNVTIVATKGGT